MAEEASWKIFTDQVRKLAEGVRGGFYDSHCIAEALSECAKTIDELDRDNQELRKRNGRKQQN